MIWFRLSGVFEIMLLGEWLFVIYEIRVLFMILFFGLLLYFCLCFLIQIEELIFVGQVWKGNFFNMLIYM